MAGSGVFTPSPGALKVHWLLNKKLNYQRTSNFSCHQSTYIQRDGFTVDWCRSRFQVTFTMSPTTSIETFPPQNAETDRPTQDKALKVNLDPLPYGTFAEIGGGQEVARWFFRVGGAAGTVAKTMSAYDMQYSDAIYGRAGRYVSKERLKAMLSHEYNLLIERLDSTRGAKTTFFVFADTVSARNFQGTNECHGWLGVRFQAEPQSPPNEIILHLNLMDGTNIGQQQALGILGVNLIYSALYNRSSLERLLSTLMDSLALNRLEIDYIELSGPSFEGISNETAGLQLLRQKLCHAVAFDGDGSLTHPSALLHKRPVLMQRGSFNKAIPRFAEMLKISHDKLQPELAADTKSALMCFELTIRGARPGDKLSDDQILRRVRALHEFGMPIFITDFTETFHITEYLRRYTKEPLRLIIGVGTLVPLLKSGFYDGIEGGLLEGLGKLLMQGAKMYVFPMNPEDFTSKLKAYGVEKSFCRSTNSTLVTADSLEFSGALQHLYRYLVSAGHLVPMENGE